jgi:DNA repair and recombination protein RAD52
MNNPIPIAKMLATKPLRSELASRPGPGNKRLTYLSGDSVTRTLNDIFGFDGWCMEIKSTTREECVQDDKGRYHVTYTAFVRVTHRRSGAFKEDCGSGDAVDKVMGVAISHALKASVTDAMKRAVRHFGDKLGNCKSTALPCTYYYEPIV